MKVAVVGAGYAGLSAALHLSRKGAIVSVFDSGSESASMASTGLLHRAPGRKAEDSWRSDEGMKASLALLNEAGNVYEQSGILRYAIDSEQEKKLGGKTLWIPEGITVYSRPYLKALRALCSNVRFIDEEVQEVGELKEFDAVVLAAGAGMHKLCPDLPLKRTPGQSLLCRSEKRLPYSLLGKGHICPTEDPALCLVGSTYEHTESPDPKKAYALLEQVSHFYPPAKDFEVVKVFYGTRVSPKIGYEPIVKRMDPKTWVFTGFGSRALLYHALLGNALAEEIYRTL